jgi:hypothetical protein
VDTPSYGLPAPWALEAVVAFVVQFTTDHGGWSIGTLLISHDCKHLVQKRKANVSSPPTGTSTAGSISTDPGQRQPAPVYRILAQESRRRETALAKMLRSRINWAMLIAGGAIDRSLEPESSNLAERREG